MDFERSELHTQVINSLVETGALNFEAIGTVAAKFGKEAALGGQELNFIINKRVIWCCGPIGGLDPREVGGIREIG